MELTYTKHGDYYLPDLTVQESARLGKCGYAPGTLKMKRRKVLTMRKKNKAYLTLNAAERRLLIQEELILLT